MDFRSGNFVMGFTKSSAQASWNTLGKTVTEKGTHLVGWLLSALIARILAHMGLQARMRLCAAGD